MAPNRATASNMRKSPTSMRGRRSQRLGRLQRSLGAGRKRAALQACSVEIRGIEPALEGSAQRRPFAVDDRVPGGIAISSLIDHRFSENAFEAEAETQRRRTRGRVEAVAFPFVT